MNSSLPSVTRRVIYLPGPRSLREIEFMTCRFVEIEFSDDGGKEVGTNVQAIAKEQIVLDV